MKIFYFSGTGNSYILAKKLSEKITANLCSVSEFIHEKEISFDDDAFGIVFPVYYGDIPNIIFNFCKKLRNIENKYIFIISNYGGSPGTSFSTTKKILAEYGVKISGFYGIQMPQNSFKKPKDNYENHIEKAEKLIDKIVLNTEKRKKVIQTTNNLRYLLFKPFDILLKPIYRKHLIKESGIEDSRENMIYHLDRSFSTDDKCISCGKCVSVCPVDNIILSDGKPLWKNKCENCLSCYNFCPTQAIKTTLSEDNYYYKNPDYII